MAIAITSPPEQGQLVNVRQRQYVVSEVAQGALPISPIKPISGAGQRLVSLSSVEDDALGEEFQVQWRDQMRDKFGLDFRIVDSDLLKDLRRKRGIQVNPWAHFPRLITSVDFLKRERPLRLFKETLPSENESVYPRRYDVPVVDEAHYCAPSGRGKYATDSQRTDAIRELTPHYEHKLFLTATPHNGYPESFSALLELLDNQRFARGTAPDRQLAGRAAVLWRGGK